MRAAERGRHAPIDDLEPANRATLTAVHDAVDRVPRDPARYHRQGIEFHLRDAAAWANERTGRDLAEQVDPSFSLTN